ncbi:hypothetical protein GJ496_002765 [Pomphorhynchus laevis]|nr:hypothetical protein GJ496_002765 [Pomphorhynchus laevis]
MLDLNSDKRQTYETESDCNKFVEEDRLDLLNYPRKSESADSQTYKRNLLNSSHNNLFDGQMVNSHGEIWTPNSSETVSNIINDQHLLFLRTLSFSNIFIGDQCLKHIRPQLFDSRRGSYIKTIELARVDCIKEFIITSRFFSLKKIFYHVGANDLMLDGMTPSQVASKIRCLIVLSKTLRPDVEVYISCIFPRLGQPESIGMVEELNKLLMDLESVKFKITCIKHTEIISNIYMYVDSNGSLYSDFGTQLFVSGIKQAMKLGESDTFEDS